MIRQHFDVDGYWEVVVYWNVGYDLFGVIEREMSLMGLVDMVEEVRYMMEKGGAKAVTMSNSKRHCSLVLFNVHKDRKDYLNSMVHEAEHIKQAMLEEYHVEDKGEPPAYTIGYLVSRMWEVFSYYL